MERVERLHAGARNILGIARDEDEAVHTCGCRQEPVDQRQAEGSVEPAPFHGYSVVDRQQAARVGTLQSSKPAVQGAGRGLVTRADALDATTDLADHEDVFSALLLARDEPGEGLADGEVRDELLTLLLAGHETTATGLAWTFDLLLHEPRVMARACEREDAYLDAVVKEALRIRPVIQGVGRVVREQPFELGGYEVPVGVEINPSIRTIHRRGDLFPEPDRFLPERFQSDDPPDTYTWIPFGGGTRRCLGASFATTEMRVVLARVLERCRLAAADPEQAKPQVRAITLAPKGGVRVIQTAPPRAAA